jgi:hypothetical protein
MTASVEELAAVELPGRVPDFFIVGHPKCGTTALYEMLRRHPQIYMPDFKEPWFFAGDMRQRFQPARSGEVPQTLGDYVRLFEPARADQRTGEASSSYLRSREAAAGIARLRPDARIIAVLREPASFLRSLHEQLLADHIETSKSLRDALARESARREGRKIPRRSHLPQMLLYSEHVRYVEQLRRYHDLFGAEQVLVLIYEDFRADNRATLRRVQQFLGVADEHALDVFDVNTSDKRMRSQQLDDLLGAVSLGARPAARAVKGTVKLLTTSRLRSRAMVAMRRNVVYGERQPPDAQLMLELRRRYRGEVLALSEYLGRDLVGLWGYERLG